MKPTKTAIKEHALGKDYEYLAGLLDKDAILDLLLMVPTTPATVSQVPLDILRDAVVVNVKLERLPVQALLDKALLTVGK